MEKHIIITGSSTTSWKDAITKTIEEASKSGKKIEKYYVDLDITFTLDRDRNK